MEVKTYKEKIIQSFIYGGVSMTPILLYGILDLLFGAASIHHTKSESLSFLFYLYLFGSILMGLFFYFYNYKFALQKIKKVLKHKEFEKLSFSKKENSLVGLYRNFHCEIFYESFAQNPMLKGSALSVLLPYETTKLTIDTISLENDRVQYLWYRDAVLLSLSADFGIPATKILIQLDNLINILKSNKVKTYNLLEKSEKN